MVFIPGDKILPEPSLYQAELSQPSQPSPLLQMLQSLYYIHNPLLDWLQGVHVSLLYCGAHT